ncbi:MAG TPA: slipin family protein [Phycisphaerales bacterium]|nr:slipin family protein [Phycisphaerales bacterium]
MVLSVRVHKHERGLLFRHGDFFAVLEPGKYRLWSRLWSRQRCVVDVVNTLATRVEHARLETILSGASPEMLADIEVVELTDTQRALVWRNDRLFTILGPGRHAFWKTPYTLRIEVFDASELRFSHKRLDAVLQHPDARAFIEVVEVEPHVEAILTVDGELNGRVSTGKHAFWRNVKRVRVVQVDRREQTADVAGQEIMTADKVTLRVNLVVTYQVTDAVKAVTVAADYAQSLYRESQLVLRAAVGARTIDALLADKESVGNEVRNALASRAAEFGVAVRSIGLRDIILPGDMKSILNQVITAQKEAEANLIRRREETAAARSQANTAKLLAENPSLARLKELEMLQSMLAGAKASFVFGSGDMLEHLRGLIRKDQDDS